MATNTIDDAIARVQAIVHAMTSVKFKSWPDYPIENADPFPMSIAYLGAGQVMFGTADSVYNFPSINVEFHFQRINLGKTYKDINAVALEFGNRLAGDPTLDGNVDTIQSGADSPITYSVRPFDWGAVKSQMLLFVIPFKTLQSPQATST